MSFKLPENFIHHSPNRSPNIPCRRSFCHSSSQNARNTESIASHFARPAPKTLADNQPSHPIIYCKRKNQDNRRKDLSLNAKNQASSNSGIRENSGQPTKGDGCGFSERFCVGVCFSRRRNTLCISRWEKRASGAKDPLKTSQNLSEFVPYKKGAGRKCFAPHGLPFRYERSSAVVTHINYA